jgi:FkbM family methyltransferase
MTVIDPPVSAELEREALWATAERVTTTVEVQTHGIRVLVHTSDDEIGRKLYVQGAFERDALLRAHHVIAEHDGGQGLAGRLMLDIGANIGTASLHAVAECGVQVVHAFEPHPDNFRLLKANIVLNDREGIVFPHDRALSDTVGEAWLETCAENSGAHALSTDGSVLVHTLTFERWWKTLGEAAAPPLDRAFAWIDVEGSEYRVLTGAGSLLAAGTPLVIEYFPNALGEDAEPLRTLLADHYTTFLDLRDPDAEPQPTARLDDIHRAILDDRRVLTDLLLLK